MIKISIDEFYKYNVEQTEASHKRTLFREFHLNDGLKTKMKQYVLRNTNICEKIKHNDEEENEKDQIQRKMISDREDRPWEGERGRLQSYLQAALWLRSGLWVHGFSPRCHAYSSVVLNLLKNTIENVVGYFS